MADLLIGVEIHKQLTNSKGDKLFCAGPNHTGHQAEINKKHYLWDGNRYLNYEYANVTALSTYELDDAPPLLNFEYVKLGMSLVKQFNSTPVDFINFEEADLLYTHVL